MEVSVFSFDLGEIRMVTWMEADEHMCHSEIYLWRKNTVIWG